MFFPMGNFMENGWKIDQIAIDGLEYQKLFEAKKSIQRTIGKFKERTFHEYYLVNRLV